MNVSFKNYHNQSFLHFTKSLLSLCLEQPYANLVQDNLVFKQMKADAEQYQKRVVMPTYSGKGSSLLKLDHQRMQLYTALKQQLQGISKLVENENAQLAKDLLALLPKKEKFSGRLNYGKRSEMISQTIKALSATSVASSLVKLNIGITLNELTKTEQAFQTLYLEQNKINADLRSLKKPQILRRELEKSTRLFYQTVELLQKETTWKELYAEMKQLYHSLQHSQHHSATQDNEKKTADPTSTTESIIISTGENSATMMTNS